jgi:hypothetical protein
MREQGALAGDRVGARSVVRQGVPVDRAAVTTGEQNRAGGNAKGSRQHERWLYARPAGLQSDKHKAPSPGRLVLRFYARHLLALTMERGPISLLASRSGPAHLSASSSL